MRKIIFYGTATGKCPVEEFGDSLLLFKRRFKLLKPEKVITCEGVQRNE